MNIFRQLGDLLHLVSILIILFKIRKTKSCAGVSLKSQELYLIVFATRYLDLLWNFSSLYLSVMKIFYLASSIAIVYLMTTTYKFTYDKEHDTFRIVFLLAPCLALALLINDAFEFAEILWTFSIYLEAVAILPQLFLLQRTGEVENLTSDYIFALGAYRTMYLFNWIYRYFTEPGYSNWIVWIAGLVQTGLYCDFFYYYVVSKYYGKKMTLPS
mmetsp:Transcript_1194/g.1625  ORF Transcript_1194/g.1625 Transcript_1194/m.1625 type:complete len:214 (+) Transcript_1194:101-742(+)